MTYLLEVFTTKTLETLWHMIITAYVAGGYHCLGNESQKYYWIAFYMIVMLVYDVGCYLAVRPWLVRYIKRHFWWGYLEGRHLVVMAYIDIKYYMKKKLIDIKYYMEIKLFDIHTWLIKLGL